MLQYIKYCTVHFLFIFISYERNSLFSIPENGILSRAHYLAFNIESPSTSLSTGLSLKFSAHLCTFIYMSLFFGRDSEKEQRFKKKISCKSDIWQKQYMDDSCEQELGRTSHLTRATKTTEIGWR